jgi:hypothetical protein
MLDKETLLVILTEGREIGSTFTRAELDELKADCLPPLLAWIGDDWQRLYNLLGVARSVGMEIGFRYAGDQLLQSLTKQRNVTNTWFDIAEAKG